MGLGRTKFESACPSLQTPLRAADGRSHSEKEGQNRRASLSGPYFALI
jgi:hypothetical protein